MNKTVKTFFLTSQCSDFFLNMYYKLHFEISILLPYFTLCSQIVLIKLLMFDYHM